MDGMYLKRDRELPDVTDNDLERTIWTLTRRIKEEKVYTYDEAIDLTGHGWYVYGLLLTLGVALQAMALDMFGFSVVVTSICDLQLTKQQRTVLLSMPFAGATVMAYAWGYAADIQGRHKALVVALWGSFVFASLCAFSPNWIVLTISKFASTCFSSGIQSLSFTLLGESCMPKLRGPLLIMLASALFISFSCYTVPAYFILQLDVTFDLGFITFSSWRLLALVLALPLGVSALLLNFFFESPKFILNMGYESKALKLLGKIKKINGGKKTEYPVKKVILKESATRQKDVPFLQSLRDQTFPLFKPPHLYHTLLLFYITANIYSVNTGFLVWLPVVADSFYTGFHQAQNSSGDICSMIVSANQLYSEQNSCVDTVKQLTVIMSVCQGIAYLVMNYILSRLSQHRKSVLIILLLFSAICCVSLPLLQNRVAAIFLYYGFMMNALGMGVIFSYYVDLFPTSYRGMATCLGVMVSRSSGLVGNNIVGAYLVSHCTTSFYSWAAYIFSGVIMCCFLPSNKTKHETT